MAKQRRTDRDDCGHVEIFGLFLCKRYMDIRTIPLTQSQAFFLPPSLTLLHVQGMQDLKRRERLIYYDRSSFQPTHEPQIDSGLLVCECFKSHSRMDAIRLGKT